MSEEVPTRRTLIRWRVSSPMNEDATYLFILRAQHNVDEDGKFIDDGSMIQEYMNADGEWVRYTGYDIIANPPMISGTDQVSNPLHSIKALASYIKDALIEMGYPAATKFVFDRDEEGVEVSHGD